MGIIFSIIAVILIIIVSSFVDRTISVLVSIGFIIVFIGFIAFVLYKSFS